MSKICYVPRRFADHAREIIDHANEILEEYAEQGYVLTVRQLYYQFVARDLLENKQKSYKHLVKIVGDARLAGEIDWAHLEDRTRNLQTLTHFDGPKDALTKLAGWYHVDLWAQQDFRPEVWIEKDALVSVIEAVCQENDVPFFSCRGYTSLSEMWRASLRLNEWIKLGYAPYIIHFGDHDPSGMDMSRDITDRLNKTFMSQCQFNRVALNMDQINRYKPPPNPVKLKDSRCKPYIKKFGNKSWELDALQPSLFRRIIEDELDGLRSEKEWAKALKEKAKVKKELTKLAEGWGKKKRRKK